MSIQVSSPIVLHKKPMRPSTPIRRRCLASLPQNTLSHLRLERLLADLLERLEDTADSSTQLLIRLYRHKSSRLQETPEKLHLFQQEMLNSLRRLHPTLIDQRATDNENLCTYQPQPVVSGRSAQATIRKLH